MLDRPTKLKEYQTYIDGKWCDAASGKKFQTHDPYTGEPWALIPECDAKDADRAYTPGGPMPKEFRGHLTINVSKDGLVYAADRNAIDGGGAIRLRRPKQPRFESQAQTRLQRTAEPRGQRAARPRSRTAR